MKKLFLILMFVFSFSLFSYDNNCKEYENHCENYQNTFEMGVAFPFLVFLQYNIENLYSFRVGGIILDSNLSVYEAELMGLFYLYNERDTGAFYFSGIIRRFKNKKQLTYLAGLGLGFKYSFNRNFHFFVEASENFYKNNKENYGFIPFGHIGLSHSF